MKSIYLCILLSVFSLHLYSQGEVIQTTSSFIHSHDFDGADRYLDGVLGSDPKNVDAIMMKGNVILNRIFVSQAEVILGKESDESIYDNTIGSIADNPRMVSKEDASKVEKLWLKCLELDPSRIDIHKGLCTLYGMALMKGELLIALPHLVSAGKYQSDDDAYSLENYALAFIERNDTNGCIEVYKKIVDLFPASGGLAGDMAVMCKKVGRMQQAVEYARKASEAKGIDMMTVYNTGAIIAIGGNIDDGCKVFMNNTQEDPMSDYYQGIVKFYRNDESWRVSIKKFISSGADKDQARLQIATIMMNPKFTLDSSYYAAIMGIEPYEFEFLLFSLKAKSNLKNNFLPCIKLARMYGSQSCYSKALEMLAEAGKAERTPSQDSVYHFYLGYTQYITGRKAESVQHWEMLTGSSDFFRRSAACYFLGKIYLERGEKNKAKKLFSLTSGHASESKFAGFCEDEMARLR